MTQAEPKPLDPAEGVIRWPLAEVNTGLEQFTRLLLSFSRLNVLYTSFWASQGLVGVVIVLVILDSMQFQKRLGAVYQILSNIGYDLLLFAFIYNVISFPASLLFHIMAGPYYGKASTLLDSFYCMNLSNLVGTQGEIVVEVVHIMTVQGMHGFQAMPIYLMLYGLPILLSWVMFSFLFAIIGDSFANIKHSLQDSSTCRDDAKVLTASMVGGGGLGGRKVVSNRNILALMKQVNILQVNLFMCPQGGTLQRCTM